MKMKCVIAVILSLMGFVGVSKKPFKRGLFLGNLGICLYHSAIWVNHGTSQMR